MVVFDPRKLAVRLPSDLLRCPEIDDDRDHFLHLAGVRLHQIHQVAAPDQAPRTDGPAVCGPHAAQVADVVQFLKCEQGAPDRLAHKYSFMKKTYFRAMIIT